MVPDVLGMQHEAGELTTIARLMAEWPAERVGAIRLTPFPCLRLTQFAAHRRLLVVFLRAEFLQHHFHGFGDLFVFAGGGGLRIVLDQVIGFGLVVFQVLAFGVLHTDLWHADSHVAGQ